MKNLESIAEELFNKVRGRFPSITIGDEEGKVTDQPSAARFFDFQYKEGAKALGSVSITLTDEALQVMYNTDFVANEDSMTRGKWYDFLKELRMFAKKRLLNFDTRNIQKSNLDKRDYQFLARQRSGEEQMNEAKLYGTSRKSYQDIGTARVTIEHTKPVNHELAAGRTQHIGSLFIESSEGERFRYPFKHLNGARAMARHVSEGGKPHDDFGKYITGLSEELANLRKFKTYMSRSAVMAEGLSVYTEAVIERIDTIKNTVEKLQRESHYNEAIDTFETAILEDVPTDVAENWIDQLTIRQFNEELKDVFPYIYKLVSEKTVAKELGPEDIVSEQEEETQEQTKTTSTDETTIEGAFDELMGQFAENDVSEGYMQGYKDYHCEDCGCQMHNCKSDCDCSHDSHDETGSWWKDANGNGVPDAMEGNAYAKAVRMAKMNGAKKGDEIEGPDGEKITIENVTEFVLSMYDRETGQFPKGETAVLTAIEKDYGEQFINPAKQFIEMINAKFEEFNGYKDPELMDDDEMEESGILYKAGVKKYGEKGMKAIQSAAGKGASHEEIGKIKDKHVKDDLDDIRRIAGI